MSIMDSPEPSTFDLLHSDVATLSLHYQFYCCIYSQSNVDRMRRISGTAFRIIQSALVSDLLRMVCALTDPPGQGQRKNAVIDRILQELQDSSPQHYQRCEAVRKEMEESEGIIRQHRNKRLVHFDLPTKEGAQDLPKLLTDHLDRSVCLLRRFMEEASSAYRGGTSVAFSVVDQTNADGKFEWMLADALRFEKLRNLAQDPTIDCETLRKMVAARSGRDDPV